MKMRKVLEITVLNPYYDEKYTTKDITLERWKNFLENHSNGNESIISFVDIKTQDFVCINPGNFASVQVQEGED